MTPPVLVLISSTSSSFNPTAQSFHFGHSSVPARSFLLFASIKTKIVCFHSSIFLSRRSPLFPGAIVPPSSNIPFRLYISSPLSSSSSIISPSFSSSYLFPIFVSPPPFFSYSHYCFSLVFHSPLHLLYYISPLCYFSPSSFFPGALFPFC